MTLVSNVVFTEEPNYVHKSCYWSDLKQIVLKWHISDEWEDWTVHPL